MKRMDGMERGRWAWGALAAAAALWAVPSAEAAVPGTLVVEGVLQSTGGGPVADGQYVVTFALYKTAAGGAPVWKEIPAPVAVKGGRFTRVLGKVTPIKAADFGGLTALWLGLTVAPDKELPRTPVHSVLFARRAEVADALGCSGCLKGTHLSAGAVTPDKVGFTWAGSKTKGGAANKALDLQCTGCVSVAEMKFDAGVDLGGNALKAKQITATSVGAGTVTAGVFVGDGSKLTGIKIPSGSCKTAGEVVKGINPDGTLKCVKAMDPSGLPPDGIDEISNGLIANQFIDETKTTTPIPIKDNNPTGVASTLNFPDIGLAQKLDVWVNISNSNIAEIEVVLFDPNNVKYTLYNKGGSGKSLVATYPSKNKPVSGDLTTWVGKNPKGPWRLLVIDHKFLNNGDDGQINAWGVKIQTLSNKKIQVKGSAIINADLKTKGDATVDKKLSVGGDMTIAGGVTTKGAFKVNGWDLNPSMMSENRRFSLVIMVRDPSQCPKGFHVEKHSDLRAPNNYVYLTMNRQGLWMGAINSPGYGQVYNYVGFNYTNVNGGKGALCWKTYDAPSGHGHVSMFLPKGNANNCPAGYTWLPRSHTYGNNGYTYISSNNAGTYIGYVDTWSYACRSDEGQGCQRRSFTSQADGTCFRVYGVTEDPKTQNGVYPVFLGMHKNPKECPAGWNLVSTSSIDGSNGYAYSVFTENSSIIGGMADWWYTGRTYQQVHYHYTHVKYTCFKYLPVTGRPYYNIRTLHYSSTCPAGFITLTASNMKGWNNNGYIQSTQAALYIGGLNSWAHADHQQGQISHNFTSYVTSRVCLKLENVVM